MIKFLRKGILSSYLQRLFIYMHKHNAEKIVKFTLKILLQI